MVVINGEGCGGGWCTMVGGDGVGDGWDIGHGVIGRGSGWWGEKSVLVKCILLIY